ncbi:protein kinase [Nonomuraea phyllanthi]|uniref:non-specific serine/threonine protein kinase n=1 Tax=Nonomuraea phyllanthi TaxID=2219224 RepID=A0A5C4V992_9ACTN|nr:serine/threonine-protein kinase [Nonomuraea phyllanthi]KAB8188306.1 protein kinase [Nonomuraea phyllanthi]
MSDATPSLVADRYRLDERIDSGPMGEVWRGYDTRADWVVAVKVLTARAAGAATREVLTQHAQAVARVIHPNVAMVLDVGDHQGAPFLVMEFLTGLSLGEEAAARGSLTIVEVCDLVGQAAAGLDAAHRAGVVHGRVGPDSFRRAGSGVLKVVGFGMDDRLPDSERYLAPERVAGEPPAAPGDLYALGCVCYELLCGRAPFEPGARGEPAPPSAFRAEVPAELDRLVLAMLAEEPARRPSSGEAIRRALATIARPRSNPAAPPVTGVSLRDGGLPPTAPGAVRGAGLGASAGAGTGPGGRQGATEIFQAAGHDGTPRAGDTAVFQAGDLPPEPPSGNRKLLIQLGAAVLVIAVVTVFMVSWAGTREEPVAQVTPTTAPSTFAPPTAIPTDLLTRTPTPDPSSLVRTVGPTKDPTVLVGTAPPKATLGEAIPPGGWRKWLSEFDNALMAQQAANGIDPRVAAKAREKIRKAARKFDEGHVDSTVNHIAGVYHDLTRAAEKGDMDPSGPLGQFMQDWRLPAR